MRAKETKVFYVFSQSSDNSLNIEDPFSLNFSLLAADYIIYLWNKAFQRLQQGPFSKLGIYKTLKRIWSLSDTGLCKEPVDLRDLLL